MLTKTVIGKKSDAHDSKESSRFVSWLKKVRGATIEHLEEAGAGQHFGLIWDDEIWDTLVHETNLYFICIWA